MTDVDSIIEFIKVQRKYASFFEWYRREKSLKELCVVESLITSLAASSIPIYKNIRPSKKDPPDVIADAINGLVVGFEVRELVDRKVVELNERGCTVYRDWTDSEVIEEIQKIIMEKDLKRYIGGPYEKLILVIPTDEPVLEPRKLKPVLDRYDFEQPKQLHEAYLIFSYDPGTGGYPHIQIRFKR